MKAIALVSGGLDSILAAIVVKEQGTEVEGVHFRTPFCIRDRKAEKGMADLARKLADQSGIRLRIIDLKEEFLDIVKKPPHGYGGNLNPCVDCRILMLRRARQIMDEEGASFLISGEVVAQRDMSQHRPTMFLVDREAGVEGIVLRPLSAQLLPQTEAEKNGWVRRESLYGYSGRSRRPQIDLAVMLGLLDFPNAAGGCLLTDPRFSQRARDLLRYGTFDMDNVELLRLGRHFRLGPATKLVVGRNEEENGEIEALAKDGDILILPPEDVSGPSSLVRGEFSGEHLRMAAATACRYSDRGGRAALTMIYKILPGDAWQPLETAAASDAELQRIHL